MKVPQKLLDRLAELERKLCGAREAHEAAVLIWDECRLAISLIQDAPNPDFAEAEPGEAAAERLSTRPIRERRTKAALHEAVKNAILDAGTEGTTLKLLAKMVGLSESRVDEMVKDLLQARKCITRGDRIMAVDNTLPLAPEAAK